MVLWRRPAVVPHAFRGAALDIGLALAAVDFGATVSQVVLMRELVATFYGSELLYGLALMAWLVWTAVGAWGIGRRVDLIAAPRRAFAIGLAVTLPLLALQLVLLRGVRTFLGVTPGAFVEFGDTVLVTLLVPALFCPLAGFLFTAGVRLMVSGGGTAGGGYVWESLGAVIGGLLVSLVFIHWLTPFQTVLLAGALNVAVALHIALPGRHGGLSSLGRHGGLPLLAALALIGGAWLDAATLRWQWPDLAWAADSPYGRLVVQARAGQRAFFVNGALAFETQSTSPEQVAHFSLLAHPDPRRVLLIGGGLAGDLREMLKHPMAHITYVEIDPQLIAAARAQLPAEDLAPLDDPRVEVVLSDGRRTVRTATERFDVIVLDLPPPSTGALNRFYTRGFFAEARARLNPDGLLALGLPSAENYWSPELVRRNASIYATLRAVFPEVLALTSGDQLFFLAAVDRVPADAASMSERLMARGIETQQVTPAYLAYVFANDRFAADQERLGAAGAVRLNEDLVPICYFYDLALWLSRFYPGLGDWFERAGLVSLGWLIPLLGVAVLLARWRRRWAVPLAIAGVGLAQMLLQVVILFAFQVVHGTLYAGVGLIVAACMAGLAGGGALGNRLLRASAMRNLVSMTARRGLIGALAGVAILSGLLVGLLWLPVTVPEAGFALVAVVAGCLPGMAFPLAVALVREEPVAVGRLYGADLLGGALGAGLCAALLVPLLGIPQVCALAALVGLAGLLCLV